jgi:hypothetical protein
MNPSAMPFLNTSNAPDVCKDKSQPATGGSDLLKEVRLADGKVDRSMCSQHDIKDGYLSPKQLCPSW